MPNTNCRLAHTDAAAARRVTPHQEGTAHHTSGTARWRSHAEEDPPQQEHSRADEGRPSLNGGDAIPFTGGPKLEDQLLSSKGGYCRISIRHD